MHKLHKYPHEILSLGIRERAFIWASIKVKVDAEKEAEKEAKRGAKRKRKK